MSNEVNVEFDVGAAMARREPLFARAQAALDEQVIKDSNVYCPEQEGTLQSSAITASKIGQGVVMYATPYARRLYYNPQYNFSHDKNPNARGKWFEEAKARHCGDWLRIAQDGIDG